LIAQGTKRTVDRQEQGLTEDDADTTTHWIQANPIFDADSPDKVVQMQAFHADDSQTDKHGVYGDLLDEHLAPLLGDIPISIHF
jgi:hypothetical protein